MQKIVLIDDDPISNLINEKIVKKTGEFQQVHICKSAQSGLDMLSNWKESDELGPELILLDIRMPAMDGFEFLDEFKKIPVEFTRNIKIAMLTSSLDEDDKNRALNCNNVIDFINKPLSFDKYRELMFKLLPSTCS